MSRVLWLIWGFLAYRWTRYVAAWIAALGIAYGQQYYAARAFNIPGTEPDRLRSDGNDGHTSIDFAGQWLMGRMVTKGYGRHLYDRDYQYEVAQAAFDRAYEAPAAKEHDADNLVINWFVSDGRDPEVWEKRRQALRVRASPALPLGAADGLPAALALIACKETCWTDEQLAKVRKKYVAGPLYPPIQSFLFAPLALDDHPQLAYRRAQWLVAALAFVGGLGISYLSSHKLWWPVGSVFIMFYPGFEGAHALGQNAPLSLAILIWGWALTARGKEFGGGLVWGLLAFKPTWAIAFLLVPMLTRRWQMAAGMILVGAALALATLPFVGIDAWRDWSHVGKSALPTYDTDENWVFLSRDLLGFPRRFLLNFKDDANQRDRWYAAVAGWFLVMFVLEATVRLTRLARPLARSTHGPAAAFVLLGAWMMCVHFMYYDVLLSAVGFVALIAEPKRFVTPLPVVIRAVPGVPITRALLDYLRPRLPRSHPEMDSAGMPVTRGVWGTNSFILYALAALFVIQNWFPYFGFEGTFRIRHAVISAALKNGSTYSEQTPTLKTDDGVTRAELTTQMVWRTPQLEVTSYQHGPAWDTLCLLGVWLWSGICFARQWLATDERIFPAAEDSPIWEAKHSAAAGSAQSN